MTAAALRTALCDLGWSGRTLARLLGYSPGAVAEWTAGRNRIPDGVAEWLQVELAWRGAHPWCGRKICRNVQIAVDNPRLHEHIAVCKPGWPAGESR